MAGDVGLGRTEMAFAAKPQAAKQEESLGTAASAWLKRASASVSFMSAITE
jgi:hypothetical protein